MFDEIVKRVIYLFGEFKTFLRKTICLDEKIKRKMELRNFNKIFQITKIV